MQEFAKTAEIAKIAKAMCHTTNFLVKQVNEISVYTIQSRVGQGKATYCRFDRNKGHFTITYGMKMIRDKLALSTARKWLSAKELERYGFYDGLLSPIHLFAHTIIHEFAHVIQNARFSRDFGKVHTLEFYSICKELHKSQGILVLEALREALQPMVLEKFFQDTPIFDQTKTNATAEGLNVGDSVHFVYREALREALQPMALEHFLDLERLFKNTLVFETVEGLNVGDSVRFVHKDNQIEGVIVKLNKKTATIQESNKRGKWRVSHHLLSKCS